MSSPTQNLSQDFSTTQTWLQKHERLILVILGLVLLYFVVDKSLGIVSNYESHKATEALAVTATQKAQADAELAQAKSMLIDYQNALATSQEQNAKLVTAIATRDKVTVVQQQTDAKLQPSQLATRWAGLVNDTGVTATATGYDVTDSAALATVQTLELEPTLKQDLADETTKSANLQIDVDKANALISQGKIAVNGLQLQITDQDKSCTAQITATKAAAKKSNFKWFGIGFGTGFVTGLTARFW